MLTMPRVLAVRDAEVARLHRDNDMLRRQNTELLTTDVGEVQTRNAELWAEVLQLRDENRRLKGEK